MDNTDKNLFVSERFREIANYLEVHKRATVEELASVLFVSEATVRRDLASMQRLGMIQRAHGGALYVEQGGDVNIFVRMEQASAAKEATVSIALPHIPNVHSIFFDNSSTCFVAAERMDLSFKIVITNGLELAAKLAEKKNVEVILIGGSIAYNTYSTNGPYAREMLKNFNVDLFLTGAAGIDPNGCYEKTADSAEIKKGVFSIAKQRILLVDSSKFGKDHLFRVNSLQEYDLVCTDASDATVAPYVEKGIKIINH